MTYRTGSYRLSPPPKRGPHHSIGRKLGIAGGVVLVIGVILAIIVGIVAWAWQYEYGSESNLTFKVSTVTNVASGSNGTGHQYLIYTGQGRVLENSDSIMHGKTDSGNVQAWLTNHQGDVVTCPTYGYRVFLLSSYKDILDGCKVAAPGTPQNY